MSRRSTGSTINFLISNFHQKQLILVTAAATPNLVCLKLLLFMTERGISSPNIINKLRLFPQFSGRGTVSKSSSFIRFGSTRQRWAQNWATKVSSLFRLWSFIFGKHGYGCNKSQSSILWLSQRVSFWAPEEVGNCLNQQEIAAVVLFNCPCRCKSSDGIFLHDETRLWDDHQDRVQSHLQRSLENFSSENESLKPLAPPTLSCVSQEETKLNQTSHGLLMARKLTKSEIKPI